MDQDQATRDQGNQGHGRSPDRAVRLACIGCGVHATNNLLPYIRLTGADLVATCDADRARAETSARHFGALRAYTDYREMLGREELDAVLVATGPAHHRQAALDALQAGLHVFVEKPPAASSQEAEEIARVAREAGRHVMVGFMKRYATANRMAYRLVSEGQFGPPLAFMGHYMTSAGYFRTERDFLLHHCVHYLDLLRYYLGDIATLSARKVALGPTRVLYHVSVVAGSGALGFVQMGSVQSRGNPVEWFQIVGHKENIVVDNVVHLTYHRDPDLKWPEGKARLDLQADAVVWRPNFTLSVNEDHKGYANELSHFVDSIANGRAPSPSIEDGIAALRLMEAMEEEGRRRGGTGL